MSLLCKEAVSKLFKVRGTLKIKQLHMSGVYLHAQIPVGIKGLEIHYYLYKYIL